MLQHQAIHHQRDPDDDSPAWLHAVPTGLSAALRDGIAARIFKIRDNGGATWRVVDVIDGTQRRAVAPGTHHQASYRFFLRDDSCEIRCYAFVRNGTRVISMPGLQQQLRYARPGVWATALRPEPAERAGRDEREDQPVER